MNAMDYLRIAPFINECPKCSSVLLGKGQGSLEVTEAIVRRTCKCGFNFEYDVNNGVSKKKIKQVIDEALNKL